MYAVITTGGKQYRVAEGDVLRVEKLDAAIGDSIDLGPVHLMVNDDGITADPDGLSSAKVTAEITGHGRRKKIRVFKYKRRKGYRRTQGHRQSYTEVRVSGVSA